MRSRRRGGTAVSIASDDDERGLGDRVTKTSDAYTDGYMDGNNSAHAELRVWQVGDHESTCVCEICRTGRVIVEHVLLPDSHIEGCSRPCGESCSCWCHAGGIVERSPRNRRQRAYNRDRVSTPCQRLRRERRRNSLTPCYTTAHGLAATAAPPSGGGRGGLEPVGVRAQLETPLPQSLPRSSAVTGSRPPLALVDSRSANSEEDSPRPSMRPTSWGSARNRRARTGREAVEVVGVVSLGTLPAGTTEAQVDDMMMVLEVADEATPAAPNRPRPEMAVISIPLI